MKTDQRNAIKLAKAQHKAALLNREVYEQRRNAILTRIVESKTPNWGNVKIIITKI